MVQKGSIDLGLTNSNKELSKDRIECGGSFNVKLSLTASPDITDNPTDIVLILDRSGSMQGAEPTMRMPSKKLWICSTRLPPMQKS